MIAAGSVQSCAVKILLDWGANALLTNDEGVTALHLGAQHGYTAVAELLVEASVDLEAASSRGNTPLHKAADCGHPEVLRALAKAGSKVNCRRSDGETPLFTASSRGHVAVFRELFRAKANPLFYPENLRAFTCRWMRRCRVQALERGTRADPAMWG